jgi:dienelactone hydrolase
MRRAVLATAAFLTLTITAAAQSRDIQIADFDGDTATDTQSNRSGGLKSSLTAEDEGRFSFPTTVPWRGRKVNIRGRLEFPEKASGKVPLVMVVHSTDGINAAETRWAKFWREQGYASFLLDYMQPRNVSSNSRNIPRSPYDVADALKVLATHPRIDTGRVAIQGLSNGATIAVSSGSLLDSMSDRVGIAPKAYIMMYGGCHYNLMPGTMPDAAYLFMVGGNDSLIPASMCRAKEDLAKNSGKDVRTVVFPGAHHGFDGDETKDFQHRRFGHVVMAPNSGATKQARAEAHKMLQRVFAGN